MNRKVIFFFGILFAPACAHKAITPDDALNTRLRDFHNLIVVGCNQDDAGRLRALYFKENVAPAGCFSVYFGHDGDISELHVMPCGVLDDELVNSDCQLGK